MIVEFVAFWELGLGAAGYGWVLLQTELVPQWVGWAPMGWGLVWMVVLVVTGGTIPAALFIMPPVIGIAMLLGR